MDTAGWYGGDVAPTVSRLDSRASHCGLHDHAVQFYRGDASLVEILAHFARQGLPTAQPLVLIATADHRKALLRLLEGEGLTAAAVARRGSVWMLDAHEVLATFMVDGMPDTSRFFNSVGGIVDRAQQASGNAMVRAFGEMVDLLWKQGNAAAAIRLEQLWNTLAASRRFTLLCAYSLDNFRTEPQGFDIGDVCHLHTHVLPA